MSIESAEDTRTVPDPEAVAVIEPEVSADEALPAEQEPVTTGTLFLMVLFLMLIFGVWGVMYVMLLNR